jgi:signal peptidase I
MLPTFQNWNYLIIEKLTACVPFTNSCIDLGEPQRGDVIVLDLPQDTSRALIKRVIGLPGDTIVISGTQPTITIYNSQNPQGFVLNEPYIDPANYGGPTNITVTLAAGQYYVLGDNRDVSADSRTWGILPRADIVGRVLLRLYPFNEIGILPGEARYAVDATSTQAVNTQ